jgi:hypothetical protein
MDTLEAIQLEAMRAVLEEDPEYLLRRIFRWYSTTYHTPLHQVEELPIEYVLQHFFEVNIEAMPKAQRKKLALTLAESKEEKLAREKAESGLSDDAFLRKIKRKEKKAIAARKVREQEQRKRMEEEGEMDFLSPERVRKQVAKVLSNTPQPLPKPVEAPDIAMSFDPNLDTEDVLAPPSRKG